jgi:hypothetical protein
MKAAQSPVTATLTDFPLKRDFRFWGDGGRAFALNEVGHTGGWMGKGRLEAFSDGVIAIIITITIMVLELKVPHGASFNDLLPVLPVLGSYVLSFIYVGIYWTKLQYGCHPSLDPELPLVLA